MYKTIIVLLFAVVIALWWQIPSLPSPRQLSNQEYDDEWTNFSGQVACNYSYSLQASGFGDAKGFFIFSRDSKMQICIVGTGMSSANLCCNPGSRRAIMSTNKMWGITEINDKKFYADTQGGVKISAVVDALEKAGLALENPPSFSELSLVGAMQTGSHGSILNGKSLAASVETLYMILPLNAEQHLDRVKTPSLINAAAMGIGSFGFIHDVTFKVQRNQILFREDRSMPFEAFNQAKFDELVFVHSHWMALQFSPLCNSINIKTADKIGTPREESNSSFSDWIWRQFNSKRVKMVQPLITLSSHSPSLTESLMPAICSVLDLPIAYKAPTSRAVDIPRFGGQSTFMEYYILRKDLIPALKSLRKALLESHISKRINFNGFVTVTFIGEESETFLSPSFRGPSAAIEISTYSSSSFEAVINNHDFNDATLLASIVEDALKEFSPLPHLAAFHSIPHQSIREIYGTDRLLEWNKQRKELDPTERLMNKWKSAYKVSSLI